MGSRGRQGATVRNAVTGNCRSICLYSNEGKKREADLKLEMALRGRHFGKEDILGGPELDGVPRHQAGEQGRSRSHRLIHGLGQLIHLSYDRQIGRPSGNLQQVVRLEMGGGDRPGFGGDIQPCRGPVRGMENELSLAFDSARLPPLPRSQSSRR